MLQDQLTPSHLPNDAALIIPTMNSTCVRCNQDLYNLWDAQCCRKCLNLKIKEETRDGLSSKSSIEEYDLKPGDLVAIWWRGNLKTMFYRMILATGTEEGRDWYAVIDPATCAVSCWGSHTVQININPCLRGGQLGIQLLL